MKDPNVRTSKFLSLVLRHHPEKIGITLDSSGWTPIEKLLTALKKNGHPLTRETLEEIVATNEKKRFALNDSKSKIRASQGHSLQVELGYITQTPPEKLYHGTATRFLDSIWESGIQKRDRHHVHLSADEVTARKVGSRHGHPIILTVDTKAMTAKGHTFFRSENGVWLTDHVPTQFITK